MFCGLFYTYNTMVMVFLQFESIWVSLATRLGQCQVKIPYFDMFNFEKQRPVSDAECPQESNSAICFFCTWSRTHKKSRLIV